MATMQRTTFVTARLLVVAAAFGAVSLGPARPVAASRRPLQCNFPGLASRWSGEGNVLDGVDGNHGTPSSNPGYVAGKVGRAFSLAGVRDRVEIPSSAGIDFTEADDYTVALWMRSGPHSNIHPAIVEKWTELTPSTGYPYAIRLNTDAIGPAGTVAAAAYDGVQVVRAVSDRRVDDDAWHHVAAVYRHSSRRIELYLDGALNAVGTWDFALGQTANGVPLLFGVRSAAFPDREHDLEYDGLLDEVEIYSRPLSRIEVALLALSPDAHGRGKLVKRARRLLDARGSLIRRAIRVAARACR